MFTSKPPTCAGRTLALPRKDRDIRYLRPLGNSDIAISGHCTFSRSSVRCVAVDDRRAVAQLRRLMRWLEAFTPCFGHRAQRLALRRYVQGLLSDSARKSLEAMLARVTEPGSYQAFQHFITDSPWRADQVWRRLRAVLPEREGLLNHRRHELPQTRGLLRWGGPPVLWGVGQGRQLPGGRYGGLVDRAARIPVGGRAVPARGVADRRRPGAGADSRLYPSFPKGVST